MELLPTIVDAIALGAACALVTLGFVLVVNATGAANLAHGHLVIVAWLIAAGIAGWLPDWPGIALLPAVAGLMALAGLLFSGSVFTPLGGRSPETLYIGTVCAAVVVATVTGAIAGGMIPPGIALFDGRRAIAIFGTDYSRQSLAVIGTAIVLVPAVWLLLGSTQFGRRLRAAAQDPGLARALGIDTSRTTAATVGLAGAIAGGAALFLGDALAAPGAGLDLTIKAYIAALIAGWGRIGTAAALAVLIAIVETLISHAAGPLAASIAVYVALLVTVMARPDGIFGAAEQRRV